MKVKQLTPNEKNPRSVTPEKLASLKKALLKFGDISGIVYNRKSKQLVGGHQRTKHLDPDSVVTITKQYSKPTKTGTVAEGYVTLNGERFSYREVSWDAVTEKAANLAANKNAGDWNQDLVSEVLKELGSFDVDFDIDLTMFDANELTDFKVTTVKEHTRVSGKTGVDEDEVPEKAPPKARLGDIYQLGSHRVMCGDSTDAAQVEKLMNGEKADLWIADPPYGVSYMEKNAAVSGGVVKNARGKKIENDTKSVAELSPFWRQCAIVANAFTTSQAASYWCACQGSDKMMMMMMMMMMLDEAGWNIRHELIWVKQQFVIGRSDYHYRHEPIIYSWKKDGTHEWFGDRKQDSVFEIDRPHKSDLHPTTKPVELFSRFIENSTGATGRVLESFGGSGTTLIACQKLGRTSYTMEIDPHYVDVIVARWEKYTGEKARLVSQAPKTTLKKKPQQTIKGKAAHI